MPVTLFFCYAREDEALLNKLKAHLRPLQRQGLIEFWYDRDISAGAEWEPEITRKLNTAQIILLLVSSDFMNSDYCYGIEMQRALERHQNGKARVIPIILRPVYWHGEPLGKLQALPTDSKPVTDPEWHDQDRAFYNITNGISTVAVQLTAPAASTLPVVTEVSSLSSSAQQVKPTPNPSASAAVLAYIKKHRFATDANLMPTRRNLTRYLKTLTKEQITEAVTDLVNTGQITERKSGKAIVYVPVVRSAAVLSYIKRHQFDTDANLMPTRRNLTRYLKTLTKEQITEAVSELVNTGQITEQKSGKAVVYVLVALKEA